MYFPCIPNSSLNKTNIRDQKGRGREPDSFSSCMVIVGVVGGALSLLLAIERLHAATVPDVRGTWTGSNTGTRTNCHNAGNNGTDTVPITVKVLHQSGATFSGSGSFRINVSEGLFTVNFSFSGSMTPAGGFTVSGPFESRRVSDNAFGGSGMGNISGTFSGNNLVFSQFDGQTTVGDTCRFTASASLTRPGAIPTPITIPRQDSHDFDGDGKADIIWRNASSTVVAVWLMNGVTIAFPAFLGGVPAEWQIKGIGDVNGDGKTDVVWQHATSGTVAAWLMNGLTITAVGFPGSTSADWKIEGVGDVNGDGKADLVWRNEQSGVVAIWLMNGSTMTSTGFLGGVPVQWQIKGIGDLNGDGKTDVLWQHATSGTVAAWLMNGLTITAVGFPGSTSADWNIEGVGDVNGDEKADLIWKNDSSNIVAIWLMNGASIASSGVLGGVPPAWEIEQVGDMNGDGKADVVLKNSANGEVKVWLMNGLIVIGIGSPGTVPSEWEIQP